MKRLEGIFKFLPDQRELPTEKQLLEQIVDVFNRLAPNGGTPDADNMEGILQSLQTKAHYPKPGGGRGKPRSKAKGKAKAKAAPAPSDDDDEGEDAPAEMNWADNLRDKISVVAAHMTNELISKSIIPYFVEWRDEPRNAQEGVACKDGCWLFTERGPPHTKSVDKSPEHNIYTYVNHNLLKSKDPTKRQKQDAATNRLETFVAQTFWNNRAAWVVQMCMICLALAGRNVDRAWWTIGPGGVGQSLNSCSSQTCSVAAIIVWT